MVQVLIEIKTDVKNAYIANYFTKQANLQPIKSKNKKMPTNSGFLGSRSYEQDRKQRKMFLNPELS